MTVATERREDGTIILTVTVPWTKIQDAYNHALDEQVEEIEIPGFRKGKAPRNVVEEKSDKTKLYEHGLQHLIPEIYNEVITQEKLKPIIQPKIELAQAEEGKDWIVKIHTCERPTVELKDYKKAFAELNATKKAKIWLPGEEPKNKEEEQKAQKPTLDEMIATLVSVVVVSMPALLLEQEVNKLLSDLVDQTKRLGLTVEQYLASSNKTGDSIRKDYTEQSKRTLLLEFGLEAIADKEGILISDDDIDAIIKNAKSEEERKALQAQRAYLATILRRQKTLDMLSSL